MSGVSRTVQINVIGDTTKAQAAFKQSGEAAESAGKVAGGAFDNVLGELNSAGVLGPFGDALAGIGSQFDGLSLKGKNLGKTLAVGGGAGFAAAGALTLLGSKESTAGGALKATISSVGDSYADFEDQIKSVETANENLSFSTIDTKDALQVLVQGTHSTADGLKLMSLATNLAREEHIGLADAAAQALLIFEGKGGKILARYGITTDGVSVSTARLTAADKAATDAKKHLAEVVEAAHGGAGKTVSDMNKQDDARKAANDATAKATALHQQLDSATTDVTDSLTGMTNAEKLNTIVSGQATNAVSGFTGQLGVMWTKVEDNADALGAKYGPALLGVTGVLSVLGQGMVIHNARVAAQAAKLAEAAKAAENLAKMERLAGLAGMELAAGELAADAAGLPLIFTIGMIAAAAVALSIIAYEVYAHWDQIWPKMKAGAESAAGVIKHIGQEMYNGLIAPVNLLIRLIDLIPLVNIHPIPGFGGHHDGGAQAAGGGADALQPAGAVGGGGDIHVHVTSNLDGKKVGEGVAKHTRGQLLRDQRGTVNTGLA